MQKKRYTEALSILEPLAKEQKDPHALSIPLALLYMDGMGIPRDWQRGLTFLYQCATHPSLERPSVQAMIQLGRVITELHVFADWRERAKPCLTLRFGSGTSPRNSRARAVSLIPELSEQSENNFLAYWILVWTIGTVYNVDIGTATWMFTERLKAKLRGEGWLDYPLRTETRLSDRKSSIVKTRRSEGWAPGWPSSGVGHWWLSCGALRQ